MNKDTKFVVFIDALSPDDLSRCDFMPDTYDGVMEAFTPMVTPSVLSTIYTGESPAENGMSRNHSGSVDNTASPPRPEGETLMEELSRGERAVIGMNLPYSGPVRYINNNSMFHSTSPSGESYRPESAEKFLSIPGPAGDLAKEKRHDVVFDYRVDFISSRFATARTLSEQSDVVFIGVRTVDEYCHFQYDANENGRGAPQGERYRDRIAEVVDIQLSQLADRGEVFWFSDHGATEKTDVFRINRWLCEKGYLDIDIDEEFNQKARERGVINPEEPGPESSVENQYAPHSPEMVVNKENTQAISVDPYDAAVTVKDDSVTQDIIRELEETGYFNEVYHKSELYDENATFYEQTADIIPDRKDGVMVSGNYHPNPIGMGWYRTGTHAHDGCYGSTVDSIKGGRTSPAGIHERLRQFLDLN